MAISKAGRAHIERRRRIDAVNAFAILEGWYISNDTEIQADDSDDVGRGFKLENDREALEHVQRLSTKSALHREALDLISGK